MSNRRCIIFLLSTIVVLACALIAVRRFDGRIRVERRLSLLESNERVCRLTISRRGDQSIVLVRDSDWRLASPYVARVESAEVMKLLDVLSFTPIVDAYADSDLLKLGRDRSDFALENPPVTIAVANDRRNIAEISFGSPTPSGDGVYAAVAGLDAVFVVPSSVLSTVDRPADGFRRRSLFRMGSGELASFDVKRGTASLISFVRNGDGWTVAGVRASSAKVKGFLDSLLTADAADFVWPVGASNEMSHASSSLLSGYGLDPESSVTLTMKGIDGIDRQVSFGKAADASHVYALVHDGGAIVTVSSALKDAAVQDAVMFTDSRLFPLEPSAISAFTVSRAGETCSLARGENGVWRLESPIAAPADAAVVDALVARLVTLSPADADPHGISVSLGTNAAPVAVSAQRLFGDDGFPSLRSRDILRFEPMQVRRLVRTTSENGDKPVSVVYVRELRSWNLENGVGGATVDEDNVAAVLKSLNPLHALRIEKLKVSAANLGDYGLDKPLLTIAIDLDREDAVRRNLLIGKRTDGGSFATVGSADAVFVLSDDAVSGLSRPFLQSR